MDPERLGGYPVSVNIAAGSVNPAAPLPTTSGFPPTIVNVATAGTRLMNIPNVGADVVNVRCAVPGALVSPIVRTGAVVVNETAAAAGL